MKKLFISLLLVLSSFFSFSQGPQTIITIPSDHQNTPFPTLVYTPIGYSSNPTRTYPLIVFLHGSGEGSNTAVNDPTYLAGGYLSKIYGNSNAGGPAYYIAQNKWPDSFLDPITGKTDQYIVISPQAPGWSTASAQLNYILQNFINMGYRVDINRIYLTGLSAGGQGLFDYTVHNGVVPFYPAAAIAPMSMATSTPSNAQVQTTLSDNVYVWGFGSESDIFGIVTHLYIVGSYGGNNGPTPPSLGDHGMFTSYAGGHCCWGQFYDPNFKQNNISLYQWFLTHSRLTNPLPITLVNFQAVANDVQLVITWETDMESNSDEFVIERSTDNTNFTDVAVIPTHAINGNSSIPLLYSYTFNF